MKDTILEYLAQGISRVKIQEILGVSAAYISEITEENKEKLAELREKYEDTRIKNKYSKLEEATLNQLKESLALLEAPILLRVLETCQKGKQASHIPIVNNFNLNKIDLVLPAPVSEKVLVLNNQREVVAFGEKNLAPLPSKAVLELFEKLTVKFTDQPHYEGTENDFSPISYQTSPSKTSAQAAFSDSSKTR